MTPTQWLAIPTEIRLAELPKLIERQADAVEMPTVLLNGKNIVIKQEEEEKFEFEEDLVSSNSNLYLYPMGNGLLATSENVALALENASDPLTTTPATPAIPATPATPVSSSTADIVILKSKPKNPDYKIKNKILATKRSRPVSMKLVRMRPGLRVIMWMAYQGHIYGDEPVKRCKKHDECVWCGDHQFNQSFCIISKCHRFELDHKLQPRAVLAPSYEHLDGDGGVPFSVVFSCWNSCDIHSRFGKDLNFNIQIVDEKEDVLRTMEFSLQCCQNLLRDAFKDRKRKQLIMAENGEEECSPKSACMGDGGQTLPLISPRPPPPPPPPPLQSLKGDKPIDVVVEGLDEERRDIIERMVRVMGGTTYRIPHLTRIRNRPGQKDPTDKISTKSNNNHKNEEGAAASVTSTATHVSTTAPVTSTRVISTSLNNATCYLTSLNTASLNSTSLNSTSLNNIHSISPTKTTTTSIVCPMTAGCRYTTITSPCITKAVCHKDSGDSLLSCSKAPITKIFLHTKPPGMHQNLPAVTSAIKPTSLAVSKVAPQENLNDKSDASSTICLKIESSWT